MGTVLSDVKVPSPPPAPGRVLGLSGGTVALLVFLLAVMVRLGMVHFFSAAPLRDLWWNDAVGWNLAQGNGFTASLQPPWVPGIFRSPGYPIFLAAVYKVSGHSYQAAYVAQALLDALTALLVLLVGRRLLPPGAGELGGLLYALYPYPAAFCGVLSQDIVLVFGVVLTLYCTVRAQETPARFWAWFLVGAALGWTVLVKPFLILYGAVPAVVALAAPIRWPRKFLAILAVGISCGVLVMPWLVRNYEEFHVFPLPAAGGTGTGLAATLVEVKYGEEFGLRQLTSSAAAAPKGREEYLSTFVDGSALVEREHRLSQEAMPQLRKAWPQYLLVMLRHVPRLWLTAYVAGRGRFLILAAQGISVAVLLGGALGMLVAWGTRRRLAALYLTVASITFIYAPVVIEARYSLPARPVMILFLAIALDRLRQSVVAVRAAGTREAT